MNKTKKPITDKVLEFLSEKSLEFLNLGCQILFDPKELVRNYGIILYGNNSYFPKTSYNSLKRSPYFESQGKKFYVTEKGRMRIIRNIIKNKNNQTKSVSNKWYGIIFDIPEADRRERSFLRKELTMAGCKELQKSVWITPFDIEKELLVLLKLWKKDFNGDIRFLRIDKISGDDQIRKLFTVK
jgi:hypothetical protein